MRLTISLDDELYRYVRARAKREDTSMSAVVNELVGKAMNPTYEGGAIPLPSLAERWPKFEGELISPPPTKSASELDYELELENSERVFREAAERQK